MTDVVEALGSKADAKWKHFGSSLRFDPTLLNTIEADNKGSSNCMLELVTKWVSKDEGTGDLPRTWETVVEAMKGSGHAQLAKDLEKKYGVIMQ